ncbi:unnamed protein product [Brassicogethes aeneus]|uniref:Uncharacterized protein n=1 Tax=Brassicogethes aeneus TaxID=1431903 RepID=A0A9P0BIT3_BRAAE|nr:unnamed protein product [Brassicogethes aeneus]
MKFIILATAISIVASIRVPTSWDDVEDDNYFPKFKLVSKRYQNNVYNNNKNNRKPVHRMKTPNAFSDTDWMPVAPPEYFSRVKNKFKPNKHKNYDFRDIDFLENSKPNLVEVKGRITNVNLRQRKRNNDPEFSLDDSENESSNTEETYENDDEEKPFVPTKQYTKVRRSDSYAFLPQDENPRLKKVIKETRIHTIYTEKGTEDEAYDHADEEKQSENGESFAKHKIENAPKDAEIEETQTSIHNVSLHNTTHKMDRRKREIKYPYYDSENINKNSPLRYSENLASIPPKTQDEMAFYNQAIKKYKCSETLPIEDIKEYNKTVGNTTVTIPQEVSKNGNLGDQIDCFKEMYFGKNPLDSPFFEEKNVEPISDDIAEELPPKTEKTNLNILTDIIGNAENRQARLLEEPTVTTDEETPESQALILRRRYRKNRPHYNRYNDYRHHKIQPTKTTATYHPYYEDTYVPTSTVLPKYMVVSEVFYKDDIKPNEQLNVFADVINNIKNNSRRDLNVDTSEPIAVKLNVNRYKIEPKKIKILSKKLKIKTTTEDYTTTPTTSKPRVNLRKRIKYGSHNNHKDQSIEEAENKENIAENLLKPQIKYRRRRTTTTTPSPSEEETLKDDPTQSFVEDATQSVEGLIPPEDLNYRTIIPKDIDDEHLNKYIVPGMRPPKQQVPILYSDFRLTSKNKNKNRRNDYYHRRYRREANKPAYSEYSRNRGRQEETLDKVPSDNDDDDDYVPHRPKNYHYDEKLGKIVYHDTKTNDDEEDEEEEEYVEEVTTKKSKPKHKTTPKPLVVTSPKPGESFIDYVKKLKSNSNYKMIEETTTTEKPTTTLKPIKVSSSNEAPQFLNLLSKLHSDSKYKAIENEEDTTKKAKHNKKKEPEPIVQEADDEEDEEDEELGPIQNSPGGQGLSQIDPNFQIFDVGDFIPKVKNYVPRTSIDYSKYKTIERPTTPYNTEDEDEDDNEESKAPPLEKITERMEDVEKSTEEVKKSTTPAPVEKSTFKIRVRNRKRPTTKAPRKSSTTTTTERIYSSTTAETVQHDSKAKRNYRRRPTRIRLRTTTVKFLDEDVDDTTKVVKRRSSMINDGNFQPIYVPDDILEERNDDEDLKNNDEELKNEEIIEETLRLPKNHKLSNEDTLRLHKNHKLTNEDTLRLPKNHKPSSVEDFKNEESLKLPKNHKLSNVEVFKKFDTTNKHGGSYRRLEDTPSKLNEEISNQSKNKVKTRNKKIMPTEKPQKTLDYTDSSLPKMVNQLKSINVEDINVDDDQGDNEENFDYYEDEVEIKFEENKKNDTKKEVNFVKDPSKRLYYYLS